MIKRRRVPSLLRDVAMCLAFYTRVPAPHRVIKGGAELARANWAAPLAGAVVGAIGAAVDLVAQLAGLPPLPAAGLAVTATVLVTGCLHEDGLADVADGLFGATSPARRLEIMRDSRIGTYGTVALIVSLLLRTATLASIAGPERIAAALIAAHMAARAMLPAFMWWLPPARSDGLSAGAGAPPAATVLTAACLGLLGLGLGLGPRAALAALIGVCAVSFFIARLAVRRIGGQTGDVLGALEQTAEVIVLLVAAAA